MKKKGFTLIELLVVISIIAMLLAILMPALGKVKEMAQRVVCGTNCKGIGTSMIIYASDYDDNFPVAGGAGNNTWNGGGTTTNADGDAWQTPDFNWDGNDSLTIAASLYLLIREVDGDPASFVCKSSSESVFDGDNDDNYELPQLWDFGDNPRDHVSYSYQHPYGRGNGTGARPATGTKGASFAVLADKNPWLDPELDNEESSALTSVPGNWETTVAPLNLAVTDTILRKKIGNSGNHKRDGQNVLYGDGHTSFEKQPDVGVRNDNIYYLDGGKGDEAARRQGGPIGMGGGVPQHATDSWLINDDDQED